MLGDFLDPVQRNCLKLLWIVESDEDVFFVFSTEREDIVGAVVVYCNPELRVHPWWHEQLWPRIDRDLYEREHDSLSHPNDLMGSTEPVIRKKIQKPKWLLTTAPCTQVEFLRITLFDKGGAVWAKEGNINDFSNQAELKKNVIFSVVAVVTPTLMVGRWARGSGENNNQNLFSLTWG